MTGLYIFLGIVGGIVLLLIAILSIPLRLYASYDNYITLRAKWLFLKFNILPLEDKPKKEKKKKEKKKKEKPAEEKPAEEKTKQKKPSPIMDMLKANGHDGMMEILGKVGHYLKKAGSAFIKAFKIKNVTIHVVVGKGDAASTAIEYGKDCQRVFPLVGLLCAHGVVRSYDVSVEPDFLANHSDGEFFADMNVCPRKLLNAVIALVFRLVFGAVLKFFMNWRKARKKDNDNNQDSSKQPAGDSPAHERMAT